MQTCRTTRLPVAKKAPLVLAALLSASWGSHAAAADFTISPAANVVAPCAERVGPLAPAGGQVAAATKTGALLGGAPSALEAIRLQQVATTAIAPFQIAATNTWPTLALAPSVGGAAPMRQACPTHLALPAIEPAPLGLGAVKPTDPENFLASKRLRIGTTSFDKDWKRVRGENISQGALRRYIGTIDSDRGALLRNVNRWVNRHVSYREDKDVFGRNDYWAGARRTLKLGSGDCEDIALVKMQMLASAGVARDDMILTIARDLVRNADHAILIVRTPAGYVMLDNATDEVIDAGPQNDYRAILSFGNRTTWLHGV